MVEPIWRRLAVRAEAMGFAPPAPVQATTDPDLRLVVGTQVIRPIAGDHGRIEGPYTFVISPGATTALLTSRAGSPAEIEPFQEDRRRLGIAVRCLRLHGRDGTRQIPIDDPCLAEGWWATEREARALWRWTDGAGRIALPPGTTMLEVVLHATHRYPVDGISTLQAA